jgi:transposase-like protein
MQRRNFDREFREGAVRIVRETGKPIAQVARELGVQEGTLGRWVNLDLRARDGEGPLSESERDESHVSQLGYVPQVLVGHVACRGSRRWRTHDLALPRL